MVSFKKKSYMAKNLKYVTKNLYLYLYGGNSHSHCCPHGSPGTCGETETTCLFMSWSWHGGLNQLDISCVQNAKELLCFGFKTSNLNGW